jgi:hypothetical protein
MGQYPKRGQPWGRDATGEERLDRHGLGHVATRTAVRGECQRRGWLKGGGNRTMRASVAQGTRLVEGRGRPVTLRSRPEP